MSAQSIRASKAPATTPCARVCEIAFANKLLLAGMQTLVALAIVLPSKSLSTHGANKRSLISMSAEMRAQIISAREALRTEIALESCGMFLDTGLVAIAGRALRVSEVEDVVAVGN